MAAGTLALIFGLTAGLAACGKTEGSSSSGSGESSGGEQPGGDMTAGIFSAQIDRAEEMYENFSEKSVRTGGLFTLGRAEKSSLAARSALSSSAARESGTLDEIKALVEKYGYNADYKSGMASYVCDIFNYTMALKSVVDTYGEQSLLGEFGFDYESIDFEKEMDLLQFIRRHFSVKDVELRVDANGAFTPDDAPKKLERLARLDLHSIEQPIRAGQAEAMASLTASSPLPIAFDEELIGINTEKGKAELLDSLKPQYIVLKPSLHGGMAGCKKWIELAEERGIGWWVTSALESNIGLNAIAQWCATLHPSMPQGLGTGLLFTDNIPMPLEIRKDCLWYVAERH